MVGLLLEHGEATIDDVRARLQLPAGGSPKWLGAATSGLRVAGIARHDGYTASIRPEAHARPVSRWVLADRVAAMAWLAANPEPAAKAVAHWQGELFPGGAP